MNNLVIKSDRWKGINLLESLGLKSQWLTEVGLKALAAYNQTTIHDAANAPGSLAYFAAVRAIRDILRLHGWEIERQCNLEITKNSEKNIRLIVSSGDAGTGISDGNPKTKNPKGNQTKKVVAENNDQITFCELNEKFMPKLSIDLRQSECQRPTWIFLYHIDISEMRMELSLPIQIDFSDMRVSEWEQRIIFSPIDFNPPENLLEANTDTEVEIVVKRRKNG